MKFTMSFVFCHFTWDIMVVSWVLESIRATLLFIIEAFYGDCILSRLVLAHLAPFNLFTIILYT